MARSYYRLKSLKILTKGLSKFVNHKKSGSWPGSASAKLQLAGPQRRFLARIFNQKNFFLFLFLASVNFIFAFVGLWAIERFGRRKLILTSLFGASVALFILSAGFAKNAQLEPKVDFTRISSNLTNCENFIGKEKFKSTRVISWKKKRIEKMILFKLLISCSACIQSEFCAFCSVGDEHSCDSRAKSSDQSYACYNQSINLDEEIFWSDAYWYVFIVKFFENFQFVSRTFWTPT